MINILPVTVKFLTQLYIEGEDSYTIEDEDKMTSVEVYRKKYSLSQEAINSFEQIHDEWELSICEKYPHDALVGGENFTIWNVKNPILSNKSFTKKA